MYDLEARALLKRFGEHTAVDGVSFAIPPGRFFSILGPSGCGKTTLLRMLAGFQEPDGGDLLIQGRSMLGVPPNKRPLNMVFQHLALFPMMSVADNIGYGLRRRGMARAGIRQRVAAMLERVGLPDAGPKRVDQLSGGQRQRIAIARALVLEPAVLLLDEPLGALDLKLREHMKVELKQLQEQVGTTFVYITHDQSEALVMSDQVAVMNHGRFEQVDTPQALYYRPASAFVAGFVGEANRWRGTVERTEGERLWVRVDDAAGLWQAHAAGPLTTGAVVELFLRPEAIALIRGETGYAGLENRGTGEVLDLLFNGANSRALLRLSAGGTVQVALPQTGEFSDLARGERIHLGWSGTQTLAFAAEAA